MIQIYRFHLLALTTLFAVSAADAQSVINLQPGANIAAAVATVGAAGGGTVNLAPGVYSVTSPILMQSNTTLNGAGSSTILQAPITPNSISIIANAGDGVSGIAIQNLVVDGNIPAGAFLTTPTGLNNPYQNAGISMVAVSTPISDITITNVEARNAGIGITLNNVTNVALAQVYVHDNNPGSASWNAAIQNCTLVNLLQTRFIGSHSADGLYALNDSFQLISNSEFSYNSGNGLLSSGGFFESIQNAILDFNFKSGIDTDNPSNTIDFVRVNYDAQYGIQIQPAGSTGLAQGIIGLGDAVGLGLFNGESYSGYATSTTPNLYEAELADGVLGAAATASWQNGYSGYSGLGYVDFSGNLAGGLLTFSSVGVVTSGTYTITAGYSNGSGVPVSMGLTVNGVSQGNLTFPSTGSYTTWGTITFTVNLNAGSNSIAVSSQPAGAPELDYIQVNTSVPAAPAAPTCVTATAGGAYSVILSWGAPAGAATYRIARSNSALGPFLPIAANVTATTYTDTRIFLGKTTWYYTVTAVNQGGASAPSAVATARTLLAPPAGLQATAGGSGVALSWMSANLASSYNVKRSLTTGGPYTTLASVTNTTNLTSTNFLQTYTDSTAVSGTTYFYVVSAVDSLMESANSYEVNTGTNSSGNNFSLSLSSGSFAVAPGSSTSAVLTVNTAAGFTTPVVLSTSTLPSGVTASFSPASVTGSVAAASTTVTVTFTAASGTAASTTTLSLKGTAGSGVFTVIEPLVVGVSQTITFNNPGNQTVGTPLPLSATASSSLAVSFSSSTSGVCTVSGGTATFISAGLCLITASQAGNSTYAPATPVAQGIIVAGSGSGNFSLTNLTSSFTVQAGGAPVSGTVNINTNACYAGPVYLQPSSQPYNVFVSILPSPVSGGGTAATTTATVTVTALLGAIGETYPLTVFGNGPNSEVHTATSSITILPAPQTITFNPIPTQTVGTPLTLVATASSGLPVSFASSTTTVCTVSGTTATFLIGGTCAIVASQAGNAAYLAAPNVSQTFTVNKEPQTITFNAIPPQNQGTVLTLTATASSGLPVSFTSTTPSVCALGPVTRVINLDATNTNNGASVTTTLSAATYTVTVVNTSTPGALYGGWNPDGTGLLALLGLLDWTERFGVQWLPGGDPLVLEQSGNPGYASAAAALSAFNAATSLTVYDQATNNVLGSTAAPWTFTLTAAQSVTFFIPDTNYSSHTGGVSLLLTQAGTGSTATMLADGTCSITASQAGNASYLAAPNVTQSFGVQQPQTITFNALPNEIVGTSQTLTATASSGLPVTLTSSTNGICTLSGTTVTNNAVGTCTITASQAGNTSYYAATPVSQSYSVTLLPQTITFNALPTEYIGTSQTLTATASSGLAVTLTSSTTGVCAISGTSVTNLAAGTCTITASQAGNGTYSAAPSVTQSYGVILYSQTITFNSIGTQTVGTPLTLVASASSGLPVTLTSSTTSVCTVSGTTATFLTTGTCTITASQAGNGTYYAATPVTQSFSVVRCYTPSTCNVYAKCHNDGSKPQNGGHDGGGYAYCDVLLGTQLTCNGYPYQLGTCSQPYAASCTTVTLTNGNYSCLKILAAGVNGNQTNQCFTINYTDGSQDNVYQSLSDWCSSAGFSGETVALSMPYRITPTGGQQTITNNLYQYSLTCNSSKTVQSITLPNNRNCVVHAITMCP